MNNFLHSDSDDEYNCSPIFFEFIQQVSLPDFFESDEKKIDIYNDDVFHTSIKIEEKINLGDQKQIIDERQVDFAFQSNSPKRNLTTNFLNQKGLCQNDKIQILDAPNTDDFLIPESFFIVSDIYYKRFKNTLNEIVLRLYRLPYLDSNYVAHLKGRWCSMDIKVHDPLLITGSFTKIEHKNFFTYQDQNEISNLLNFTYEITIDNTNGFIVQWPFFQVSPSRLSESAHCFRRSILCSLVPSDTIETTLKRSEGQVGHLLFENTMMQQLEPNQANLIEIVNNHAIENGLQESMRKQIIENSKPIIDLTNKVSINIKNQETEKKLDNDISNLTEKQKEFLNQIQEEKQKILLIEQEKMKIEEEKQKIRLEKKEKSQLEAERQKIILELESQNQNQNENKKILLEKKEQIQLEFERQQILLEMEIEMQKEEERQKNLLEEIKKEIIQKRIEQERIKKELEEAEIKKEKIKFLNNDIISLPPYGLDVIIAEKYYQCLQFGYVGQIDMILFDSKNQVYIPFEIKTGRSANGNVWKSHQIQLSTYIQMMKDFQKDKAADYGRIFYAKDEVSKIIKPNLFETQSLEILRNSITQKSLNGTIPPKIFDEKECANCDCLAVCQFLTDIEDLEKGEYQPSNRPKIKIKKKNKFTKRKKNFFNISNQTYNSNEDIFKQNNFNFNASTSFQNEQNNFNSNFIENQLHFDQVPFNSINSRTENKEAQSNNEKSIELKLNHQIGGNQDIVYISDKSDDDEYDYQERRKHYEEFYEDENHKFAVDDDDEEVREIADAYESRNFAVDDEVREIDNKIHGFLGINDTKVCEEMEKLPEYSLSQANFYKKINKEVLDSIYEKGFILYSNLAKTVDQRIEEGIAINGLTLNYNEILGFSFQSDKFINSKFKANSKFVITKNGRRPILSTGVVTSINLNRNELFIDLDNTNDLHYFESDLCVDLITFINDRNIRTQNLHRLYIYMHSKLSKITSMLIDNKRSERIDEFHDNFFFSQFNEDQRNALQNSINSTDYAIISGCKSSGKTVLLSGLIQYLSNKKVCVLIICPSESSLNCLCDMQKDVVAIKRINDGFMMMDQLGFFYAMTINEFNHNCHDVHFYDILIVDDCERIKISDLIGPMNMAKKFIFVGDIYQSRRDESSIFSFVDIEKNQVNFLRTKYDKSSEVHFLENSIVYNYTTKLDHSSTKIHLNLSKLEDFHHIHQSWLIPVLSSTTFFIDTEINNEKSNKICIESIISAALAVSLVICGVRKKSIGILCYDTKCPSLIKKSLSLFFESLAELDDTEESIEVNHYLNYYKNFNHKNESNRILIVCLGELDSVSSNEASLSILEAKEKIFIVGRKTIVEMNPFFCKLVKKISGSEKISYDVLNSNEYPFNRMNELI